MNLQIFREPVYGVGIDPVMFNTWYYVNGVSVSRDVFDKALKASNKDRHPVTLEKLDYE